MFDLFVGSIRLPATATLVMVSFRLAVALHERHDVLFVLWLSLLFCLSTPLGNLHINFSSKGWNPDVEKVIEPYIYELIGESNDDTFTTFHVPSPISGSITTNIYVIALRDACLFDNLKHSTEPAALVPCFSFCSTPVLRPAAAEGGSISAEHGLGLMKAPHVHYSKTDDAIEMMKQVKQLFDPKGIMSEYPQEIAPTYFSFNLHRKLWLTHLSCIFFYFFIYLFIFSLFAPSDPYKYIV